MAQENENGQEKTEDASSRKLNEARNKGEVPKSKEVPTAMVMAALLLFTMTIGKAFFFELTGIFIRCYNHMLDGEITIYTLIEIIKITVEGVFPYMVAFVGILMVAGIAGNLAMFGFIFSTESLKIDFTKINPISKMKELFFSINSLIELGKGVLKLVVLMSLLINVLFGYLPQIISMGKLSTMGMMMLFGAILVDMLKWAVLFFVFIAIFDWVYQKWAFSEKMKMTKQETKDEFKNTEGDPQIKSQQRQKRMEMMSNQAQNDVQGADVVITNPTHFAVAIKYNDQTMSAPRVVAKGVDHMAQQIKKVAKEAGVTVYEAPPLARFLHKVVEVGHEIPEEAYKAVAEILIYVFRMKGKLKSK